MLIKRHLFSQLEQHLQKPEITLLVGPRQAGKTTLIKTLQKQLIKEGKPALFLNYDIQQDRQFLLSQQKLVNYLNLKFGNQKAYIFLDEIQRKKNAGLFLKGLYDQDLPYKFIVSGSGSLELKESIHESLAGRKRLFQLSTVNFPEFAAFRTNYQYSDSKLSAALAQDKLLAEKLLTEYLNFGGYPRVITSQTLDEKKQIINEIYQSYLHQDVLALGIKKTSVYQELIELIAHQGGNLTNYHKLSTSLNISQPTVKKYLWYAQQTFILHQVRPFFTNPKKEITKSPLFYFEDLGLLNFSLGQFGKIKLKQNVGLIFENFVWRLIWDHAKTKLNPIKFWRSKHQAEVDFIIGSKQEPLPIEVKKSPKITRSLHSFINQYQPKTGLVVNTNNSSTTTVEKTTVQYMPYYRLPQYLETRD